MKRNGETNRLISDLLVRAGMLMEDIGPECVRALPAEPAEQRHHARQVGLAGIAIGALTIAAWALSETVQRR